MRSIRRSCRASRPQGCMPGWYRYKRAVCQYLRCLSFRELASSSIPQFQVSEPNASSNHASYYFSHPHYHLCVIRLFKAVRQFKTWCSGGTSCPWRCWRDATGATYLSGQVGTVRITAIEVFCPLNFDHLWSMLDGLSVNPSPEHASTSDGHTEYVLSRNHRKLPPA